ncbi:hypothetical protein [Candidatus Aquarickettsia rohweri]|uniref:Uncharacterized protein n=1 Tax=Candidatus Aquarickettsia rohweri TaxID=2602574 RepID=A0A429XES8_9RICK|nr:hypothetical protein [Candidatus Aquarickettsia rohweri]RST62879.1 hypothetical protein EIC27_05865 [Candidatus Aquarickettsia rohweri]
MPRCPYFSAYKSLDSFRKSNKNYKNIDSQKLKVIKDNLYSNTIERIKGESIECIIKSTLFILVAIVFLYIHWKIPYKD